MTLGVPTAISDEEPGILINPRVQIAAVALDSPAQAAGIKLGDTIKAFQIADSKFQIDTMKELQELTEKHLGKEVILTIERGREVFEVSLIPRVSPPEGQGPLGVALVRTAIKHYPWWQAIWQGISGTFYLTGAIILGLGRAFQNLLLGLPTGVQVMGPIGIFDLFAQVGRLGAVYFLQLIVVISLHLAIINILPIPALDGGKLLFLGIEAVRRKPVSSEIEKKVTAAFFTLLIILMIWVTIRDIIRIF